jgi:hypothetical protein
MQAEDAAYTNVSMERALARGKLASTALASRISLDRRNISLRRKGGRHAELAPERATLVLGPGLSNLPSQILS